VVSISGNWLYSVRMRRLRLVCVSGLAAFASLSLPAARPTLADSTETTADFFVGPRGDDNNPGTLAAPFATLTRAKHAVRKWKQANPDGDIRVLLRGGTYRLRETEVFGLEDGAPAGLRIIYAAYPGEVPVITSAVPINGWKRGDSGLLGASRSTGGKIWSATIPPELTDVVVLFGGRRRLPRARSQGFRPPAAGGSLHELPLPARIIPDVTSAGGLELLIVPTNPWVMNILPIIGYDETAGTLRTAVPGTYPLGETRFGHFPAGTAWIENDLRNLDEPGEWVFDPWAKKIHLWPLGPEPSDNIAAPLLTELIRIEGRINYDGPADEPVRGLVFRGLHFTQGDRFRWENDKAGWGLQHDWEMFDRPTGLIRLRGAEDCVIEACRFTNSGGAAVRLDLHARNNVIRGNTVSHMGGTGILMAGYGPGSKDVNRGNIVEGNHIHHVGELLWHSPAIFAWQSGSNRIRGNLIHHCPYTAIVVSGRIVWDPAGQRECSRTIRWADIQRALPTGHTGLTWAQREPFLHGRGNLVEGNEIHDVMEVLADGNCIYVSGTGGGNIIRRNYLHDVASPNMNAAIRCDDDQHETTITGNLVWKTCGEGFIFKGKNTITHNIVADLRACTPKDGHPPRGFLVLPYGEVSGAIVRHNIFYCTQPGMKVMTEGRLRGRPAALLRDCKVDRNLYFCPQDSRWARTHLREQCEHGAECHSRVADPQFVDPDHGDFRLLPNSPAHELGFKPAAVVRIDRTIFPFNE